MIPLAHLHRGRNRKALQRQLAVRELTNPQLRLPEGILGIARPKREHRVGQRAAIDDARVHADQNGAVGAPLDVAGIQFVILHDQTLSVFFGRQEVWRAGSASPDRGEAGLLSRIPLRNSRLIFPLKAGLGALHFECSAAKKPFSRA